MMIKYPLSTAIFSIPFRMDAKKWVTISGTTTPMIRGVFFRRLMAKGLGR